MFLLIADPIFFYLGISALR